MNNTSTYDKLQAAVAPELPIKSCFPLLLKTTHSKCWKISDLWHPDESLSAPNSFGERDVIPKNKRKFRQIPPLNRRIFNTIEKNGVYVYAGWPQLVFKLIEAGLRKNNLAFRVDHKRNIENVIRWIAYNSDAVTGCINVTKLCVEIAKDVRVASSTISIIMKELFVMGLIYEPNHSQSAYDIIHGGRLPRTFCATPLFYDVLGVKGAELARFRMHEISRREVKANKNGKKYCPAAALKEMCQNNILRVWEYRHAKETSSYRTKLSEIEPAARLAYIARKFSAKIKSKGWNISTEAKTIIKMANNLLSRMGLSVKQSEQIPIE